MEQNKELLEVVQLLGLEPDVVTYNVAIGTCETAKHSDKAWELLEEMQQHVISYSAVQCM